MFKANFLSCYMFVEYIQNKFKTTFKDYFLAKSGFQAKWGESEKVTGPGKK